MKVILVRDGKAENVALGGTEEWLTIVRQLYDVVLIVVDNFKVSPGDDYNAATGEFTTPVEPE